MLNSHSKTTTIAQMKIPGFFSVIDLARLYIITSKVLLQICLCAMSFNQLFPEKITTGEFVKYTFSNWCWDEPGIQENMFSFPNDQLILVGPSMGTWTSLHLVIWRSNQIVRLLIIVAASNFDYYLYNSLTPVQQRRWIGTGVVHFFIN